MANILYKNWVLPPPPKPIQSMGPSVATTGGSLPFYQITGRSGNFIGFSGYVNYNSVVASNPIDLLPDWLKLAYDKNGPVRIVIDAAIKEGLSHAQIVEKASHFFYRAYTEKGYMEKQEFKINPLLQAPNSGVKPEIKGFKIDKEISEDFETAPFKQEYLVDFINYKFSIKNEKSHPLAELQQEKDSLDAVNLAINSLGLYGSNVK